MSDNRTDNELYEKAKKRVEEKRGFFFHLSAYIVVNIVHDKMTVLRYPSVILMR